MQDRLSYLESHSYKEEFPFFADDIEEILQEIFHPRNVQDISNMDNDLSYEYLVALDNKGFLSESVDLGAGVTMQTMDKAVDERNLHYLYVQVSTVKPFLFRSIWQYLQGGDHLNTFADPLTEDHKKVFADLDLLAEKYSLIYVTEKDLLLSLLEEDEEISFEQKYFDRSSDY